MDFSPIAPFLAPSLFLSDDEDAHMDKGSSMTTSSILLVLRFMVFPVSFLTSLTCSGVLLLSTCLAF